MLLTNNSAFIQILQGITRRGPGFSVLQYLIISEYEPCYYRQV